MRTLVPIYVALNVGYNDANVKTYRLGFEKWEDLKHKTIGNVQKPIY